MTRSLSDLEPGSAEDRPSCPRVFACGPLVIGEVLGTFGRGAERTDLHLTEIVRLLVGVVGGALIAGFFQIFGTRILHRNKRNIQISRMREKSYSETTFAVSDLELAVKSWMLAIKGKKSR